MELKDIRNNIDVIDLKMLRLINERMELALLAKKMKTEIEDKSRENEIMENIKKTNKGLISDIFCEKVFTDIMTESKRLQKKDSKLIAFQGEHGANAEVAATCWDNSLLTIPCKECSDIFDGLESGIYDYGIVPIENTLGGVVSEPNELLIESNVYVYGAVEMPVHHCLMTLPNADYRNIHVVYSHPQALIQCRSFLSRNRLEATPYYNTAAAAKMLAEEKPRGVAVIASSLAAQLYNLEIIKSDISDIEDNKTRFLILTKEQVSFDGNKCSILFTTDHKAGTLFGVLEVFAKANINLTRIESIPYKNGSYAFFLDFIGTIQNQEIPELIEKVRTHTSELRFMGCYTEKKVDKI